MTDIWEERKKALENEFFHRREKELLDKLKTTTSEKMIRELSHNRCPKCGEPLQTLTFRGVPLDKCPGCGGVWLGPRDLQALAEKDHRTWFDKWFRNENNE